MLRKVLFLIMTIIILVGVSGCMDSKKHLSSQEKEAKVLEYLKNKYDEEFVPLSISQSGWGQGYDVILLYPKNGSKDDYFEVNGSLRKDGSYFITDGYFKRIIYDEYEAVLSDIVDDIYKDFKVYVDFGTGVCNENLKKGTKIEEIYDIDKNFSSYTKIIVKESSLTGKDISESLENIAKKMKGNKLVGTVKIYLAYNNMFDFADLKKTNELPDDVKDIFMQGSRKYIDVDSELEISEVENG